MDRHTSDDYYYYRRSDEPVHPHHVIDFSTETPLKSRSMSLMGFSSSSSHPIEPCVPMSSSHRPYPQISIYAYDSDYDTDTDTEDADTTPRYTFDFSVARAMGDAARATAFTHSSSSISLIRRSRNQRQRRSRCLYCSSPFTPCENRAVVVVRCKHKCCESCIYDTRRCPECGIAARYHFVPLDSTRSKSITACPACKRKNALVLLTSCGHIFCDECACKSPVCMTCGTGIIGSEDLRRKHV